MQKYAILLKCLTSLVFIMMSTLHASPKTIIQVGITPSYPPFEYRENNKIVGLDVDLIQMVAKELNWQIVFKELPFHDLIPALKNDQIDLAISAINMIPERKKYIDFSTSYYQPHELVWAMLKNRPSPFQTQKSLKVGAQRGTYMENWIHEQRKLRSNLQVEILDSTPQLFEKLQNKLLDAILVEEIQALHFDKLHPSLIHYHTTDTMIESYGIAFKKGSALTAEVNKVLEKLINDGTIHKLSLKWDHRFENIS